jgi:hypothetical protein
MITIPGAVTELCAVLPVYLHVMLLLVGAMTTIPVSCASLGQVLAELGVKVVALSMIFSRASVGV